MAAKDKYHELVRRALQAEGWTLTHDPYRLDVGGGRSVFIDLAAERGAEQIAVEIKTFGSISQVADLQQAVGQHTVYQAVLDELDPTRKLRLAVPSDAVKGIFSQPLGKLILRRNVIQLISYDIETEELAWIP